MDYYRPRIPLASFFPQTFRLDLASECDKFIQIYQSNGEHEYTQGAQKAKKSSSTKPHPLKFAHTGGGGVKYSMNIPLLIGKKLWICKPTGANQGKGIFLVRDLEQVLSRLEQDRKSCKPTAKPVGRIVQW